MKQIIESKIKEIADLINAGLTKQEFIDGFKKMLEHLKELEKNLNFKIDEKTQKALDDLSEVEKAHRQAVEKIEQENQSGLSNLKKWALEKIGQLFINSRIKEKITELDAKLTELNAYKAPDASIIALEASKMAQDGLLPLIPIIDKLEEKLPQMGDLIANALEVLPENKKLEISAIKDLKEELEKLENKIRKGKAMPAGGVGGGGRIAKVYDLSASLDGVTKTFTLPAFWRVISVHSSSFPNVFRPTTDYTTDAGLSTITFTD